MEKRFKWKSEICMKGIEVSGRNKTERNFTLKKFLQTGRELVVETRASLHTSRGKWGLALFLLGFFVGIYKALTAIETDVEQDYLIIGTLWSVMGLVILLNLQNYKLLYLLPVSRKEFAAGQMRKMAWVCLIFLGIITAQFACMQLGTDAFWRNVIWKSVPASISLSAYQIAWVKPVRGSEMTGTKMYSLSFGIILLDLGLAFLNLMVDADSWSVLNGLLPVLNYGISIYATIYFYRKVAFADLYYDEL